MMSKVAEFPPFLWPSRIHIHVYTCASYAFIQSSVGEHACCLQVLATVNDTSMDTGVREMGSPFPRVADPET